MCGIFGIAVNENGSIDRSSANKILDDLFILSESRGKEASGLAYKDSEQITYLK